MTLRHSSTSYICILFTFRFYFLLLFSVSFLLLFLKLSAGLCEMSRCWFVVRQLSLFIHCAFTITLAGLDLDGLFFSNDLFHSQLA